MIKNKLTKITAEPGKQEITIQKITPHLWFDKEAKEAAEFYTSIYLHRNLRFHSGQVRDQGHDHAS